MEGIFRARRGVLPASMLLVALFASDAAAQDWTGAGFDDNWSAGANWSGGVAPASSGTTQLRFFSGGPSVVDVLWTVNRIDFFANSQLSGQTLTFAGADPVMNASAFVEIANPIDIAGGLRVSTFAGLMFNGVISGTGPLSIGGVSGASLAAANTFAGGLQIVPPAAVAVNGSVPGPVNVGDGAVLGGSGTIFGPVTVAATGGTISASAGGVLTTGDLAVAGFVAAVIGGPSRGTQYGGLNVSGTVSLVGARLSLTGSYVPAPGDVFLLVDNDGVDAVSGTFAGLPEGGTLDFNGVTMRISYVGGTGNDITLAAVAPVVPAAIPQVPTLSEQALIMLAMGVLAMGASYARRQR
jgi:hypothetical protein